MVEQLTRCIEPAFFFTLGVLLTRWTLTPRFCPTCLRAREWTAKLQKEREIAVESKKDALGSSQSDEKG